MNQFFSFKRFSLLVFKHWAENKKRYGLSIVALLGLLIAWFVFTMLVETDQRMTEFVQQATFYLSLFAVGSFYASQYFKDLGSREKGSSFLLVPASSFEKLLCSLLYCVVLFFVVFLCVFYLADSLMVAVSNALPGNTGEGAGTTVVNVLNVNIFPGDFEYAISLLQFFFPVQSAFLLGSVYFKKFSFVKTVIAGFVAFFISFCLLYLLFDKLLPNGEYFSVSTYRVYVDGINDHLVGLPVWIGQLFRFIIMYAIAPFLWLVTYFRLKEKQV